MKICSGGYVKLGISEHMITHPPIVFDEQSAPILDICPLCYEKAWHEDTADTLRQTEKEVGELKSILADCNMEYMIP